MDVSHGPHESNAEVSSENQREPEQQQDGAEGSRNPMLHQPFLQYFGSQPPSGQYGQPLYSQAHLSASQSTLDPQSEQDDGTDQQNKPKRNPRQQEQNKQAQQRYRAKRKAQFEEMQGAVAVLSQQVQSLQQEKQSSRQLQAELARMQALLADKEQALQPPPAAAAELSGASPAPLLPSRANPGAKVPPADVAGAGAGAGLAWRDARMVASGAVGAGHGGGGTGPVPLASSEGRPRQPPSGSAAPMHSAGRVAAATAAGSGASGGGGGAGGSSMHLTPALVQHALQMYYQDLQYHASVCHLEHLHPGGLDASPGTMRELHRLLQAGTELIKMVLQASGPGAQELILGEAAGAVGASKASSPADNHQLWQQVAVRLQLTSVQVREIGVWQERFVQQLDEVYGRRLLLKAQVVQMTAALGERGQELGSGGSGEGKGGPGEQPQWAESLLLQSVSSLGYSASALAVVELDDLVAGLRENLRQEREMAGSMMQILLTQLLMPVQAARYLLAGHPFTWNGLAFAHALAAMQAPRPPPSSAPY